MRLQADFGVSQELIRTFSNPYLDLDRDVIAARGLDQAEVEAAVAEELQRLPGIAFAVSSSAPRRGALALTSTRISEAVLANLHRDRSGDIYVVFEPHWFGNEFDGLKVASAHGSPWVYDTHVPIIFARHTVRSGRVFRNVGTIDVAPLVAADLGTGQP